MSAVPQPVATPTRDCPTCHAPVEEVVVAGQVRYQFRRRRMLRSVRELRDLMAEIRSSGSVTRTFKLAGQALDVLAELDGLSRGTLPPPLASGGSGS